MNEHRPRILLAEDDPALATVTRFNLQRAGFAVTEVHDGEEAWQRFENESFDLVITDQQMPLLTGVELCRRIRQSERGRDVPLVLLTAKRFELEVRALKEELDVRAVFPKPFSPSELVAELLQLLAVSS